MTPGTKLGPYKILSLIGKGGMGEVYRARDTTLKRDVALKILPEAFARDPERLARFQREAEVLASLNHPNIAAIYGIEQDTLVMELVEGESPKGRLSFDDAWKIGAQIAAALEYAHDRGIVHRDLKPANVKITTDGTVKLLDFGLAKAFIGQKDASPTTNENSPTLTIGATEVGVILGTAAYMSPEQARGKQVDKRADIWAFGVLMYELVTGHRPFQGGDVSETLASVIKDEPDWKRVPDKAQRLLRGCLEKYPKQRLRDIGDAWRLLEEQTQLVSPSRSRLGWVVAGIFVLSTLALAIVHFREAPPPERSVRFQVPLPEKTSQGVFESSPDGRYIAFTALQGGRRKLWVKALDSLELRELPGTENANYPFWSPDSASIGFFAQGKLKKIAVAGGPSVTLCDASDGHGGTWNRDGVIVFSPASEAALMRVSASGGHPTPVTKLTAPADMHRYPVFLPDGSHFLYTVNGGNPESSGIYAASLDGRAPVRLLPDISNVEYAPPAAPGRTGHLLFRREAALIAEPFDPGKLTAIGELFPVVEQVATPINYMDAAFSASPAGVLAYASSAQAANRELVWMDRGGKRAESVGAVGPLFSAALSPNDSKISYSLGNPTDRSMDVWLVDVARGVPSRFTFRPGLSLDGVWSPDGVRIAFMAQNDPSAFGFRLYQKPTSGTGREELLSSEEITDTRLSDWSMNGRWIAYSRRDPKTGWDLWLLPMQGDRKPIPYLQTPFDESSAQFSPDGKWMAYVSNESGQPQVYVQSIPAGDAKWQVSAAGGSQPRWRKDGKELFYISADDKLTAVPVKVGAIFEAGPPETLFEIQSLYGLNGTR